ncbi:NAD(P)-dependent oxidoreductase [Nonomuraea longicatena]|uniref:NAD(P)-dependent oxidoreductase n=1 Tax=Nonomuraea longicatena TaxID=83682 RepID=A0ABN1QYY6_9ACTN
MSVVGLGPMGAKMAETFIGAGYDVTVWNRTASKADPLVALGARRAERPTGDLMVISQIDYQAMFDSLDGVDLTGKVLVNLSSDSPSRLREAAEQVAARGGTLITGGIMFWSILTSVMHSMALLSSAGVAPSAGVPYFQGVVGSLAGDGPFGYIKILAQEVEEGVYPGGDNSLHMQAVGAEHALHAFAEAGLELTLPTALKELFARADAEGHGAEGLGAVIEAIRKP